MNIVRKSEIISFGLFCLLKTQKLKRDIEKHSERSIIEVTTQKKKSANRNTAETEKSFDIAFKT